MKTKMHTSKYLLINDMQFIRCWVLTKIYYVPMIKQKIHKFLTSDVHSNSWSVQTFNNPIKKTFQTLQEQEKILVTSTFSRSNNVFYRFHNLTAIFESTAQYPNKPFTLNEKLTLTIHKIQCDNSCDSAVPYSWEINGNKLQLYRKQEHRMLVPTLCYWVLDNGCLIEDKKFKLKRGVTMETRGSRWLCIAPLANA